MTASKLQQASIFSAPVDNCIKNNAFLWFMDFVKHKVLFHAENTIASSLQDAIFRFYPHIGKFCQLLNRVFDLVQIAESDVGIVGRYSNIADNFGQLAFKDVCSQ